MSIEILQFTPSHPDSRWEERFGLIGWEGDELFISAACAGMSDVEAILCCSFDGEKVAMVEETVLIPEIWARTNRPDWADVFDKIRAHAESAKKKTLLAS